MVQALGALGLRRERNPEPGKRISLGIDPFARGQISVAPSSRYSQTLGDGLRSPTRPGPLMEIRKGELEPIPYFRPYGQGGRSRFPFHFHEKPLEPLACGNEFYPHPTPHIVYEKGRDLSCPPHYTPCQENLVVYFKCEEKLRARGENLVRLYGEPQRREICGEPSVVEIASPVPHRRPEAAALRFSAQEPYHPLFPTIVEGSVFAFQSGSRERSALRYGVPICRHPPGGSQDGPAGHRACSSPISSRT